MAMHSEMELLQKQPTELRRQNEELKKENQKLKRVLDKKIMNLIRNL